MKSILIVAVMLGLNGCVMKYGNGDMHYHNKVGFVNADGNQIGGKRVNVINNVHDSEAIVEITK